MKVYIVEEGSYENSGVVGVYSTLEKAIAAHPPRPADSSVVAAWKAYRAGTGPQIATIERDGGWQKDPEMEEWGNGLDWHDAASITAYEVDEVK